MRTAWALGLLLLWMLPLVVNAQFDYTTDNGKVTITRYTGPGGEVAIPSSIDGFPVTRIGDQAFSGSSVTSVEILDGVTSIGDYAFDNCSSLTRITIPESVNSIGFGAFIGCSSLTSVTIPNSVTRVEDRAFSYCSSLTRVTIGNSVISIGEWAFSFCSLTSVTIPDSVTSIGHYAFTGCSSLTNVAIGKSVASIGEEAFSGCSNLTSVTIPDSVTSIGSGHMVFGDPPGGSFSGCTSLTSVTIGNSVTGIGVYAFYGCSSLTNVTIGKSVASIGDEAFSGCSSLTSITIPESVTSIGFGGVVWGNRIGGAFSGCNHLTVFAVETLNPVYSSRQGVLFDKSQTALLQCPPGKAGSYTIPNGVTRIGDSAFSPCSNLTSVTIPDNVTSIGPWAFSGCQSLTAAYFKGNAPSFMECSWPNECPPFTSGPVIIYYLPGTSGWGSTFSGRPTALWVNHPPEFGPVPDRELVEGDEFDLELSVIDADVGQVLTYALLAGPSGLVLDAQAGRLTWSTGEGDGPSEHTVTVTVTDDGYPPLSATNSFVVRVLETNSPPQLEAIPDVAVREGELLRFVATASDADRPVNTLRFTLAPGAPVGVTLDPITGEFLWTPSESDGPRTNELAIVVTDDGLPPLSDSRPFQIIVLVGPVNEPPVLTLPAGDQPLAYVENDGPRILDLDARVTDNDSPDFGGGSLRVELASGGAVEDRLAIRDEGAGATNITLVAEQRVQYGGVEIGTFEGGTDGTAPLRVIFNGSATVAAVERLVRNVTYENVSESPSSAPRSLRLSLEDGDGGTSDPVVRAIEVTPVNDPPVALPDSAATSLNQPVSIAATKLTANDRDVDSTNLTLDLPTTTSAQGGTVALTDGRVVYQPPDAFLGEDVFEYRLQDDQGGWATGRVTVLVQAQFDYTIDNGKVTITRYNGPGGEVEIPSSIDGLPVTTIGRAVFSGSGVTSVTIPDSVTSIGQDVFRGCSSLVSVTIGQNVASIGEQAFSGCSSLTSITIPDSVTSIGNGSLPDPFGEPLGGSFYGCTSLTSVTIGNSVVGIGVYAFYGCSSLTNVTIGRSVASIGDEAFSGCSSLTSITIPDSVTSIGFGGWWGLKYMDIRINGAFFGCNHLTAFTVGTLNPVYSSRQGVLFDKSQTALLQCPPGKAGSYTIPNGVTRIGDSAFSPCSNLTSVTIPDSVTSLGQLAFSGCQSLTAVYFKGNAPSFMECGWPKECPPFTSDPDIIYYLPGTSGWGSTFSGRPTALWVNHVPEIAPIPDRELVEGDVLDVVLSVTDSDAGQVLTYALLAGPSGLVLDAQAGRLTWSTGEVDGPSEYTVTVTVTDDGYPPLSATNSFVVRVLETNSPPQLEAIPDVTVREGELLRFVATASDADRPANTLRYTLAPGAPVGVTLDPITGEFLWTPSESDGPSTNELAIVVTDNGLPPLSDSRPFQIIILAGPVNEPPVLTLPAGDHPLAYVENDGPRIPDLDARVTDNDSPDFDGGSLRVEFASGGAAEDRLAIRDEGAGATNITLVAEQRIQYGGVEIGTFEGGTDGTAPLKVTFNGSATVAAVERLVRNVTYENVSESPSSAPRSLRLSLEDGDGGTSVPVVRVIEVVPVNDPPVALPDSADTSLNQAVRIDVTQLTANDSDVDSTHLTLDLPTTASAQGGTVALTDGKVVYQPPDAFLGEDVFEYRLQDDQGGWATGRVTVLVRPTGGQLNIASITVLEDGSVRLVIAGVPGWTYSVENSPDVVVWTPLGSLTVGPDGLQDFTDPEAGRQEQRFYRIVGSL